MRGGDAPLGCFAARALVNADIFLAPLVLRKNSCRAQEKISIAARVRRIFIARWARLCCGSTMSAISRHITPRGTRRYVWIGSSWLAAVCINKRSLLLGTPVRLLYTFAIMAQARRLPREKACTQPLRANMLISLMGSASWARGWTNRGVCSAGAGRIDALRRVWGSSTVINMMSSWLAPRRSHNISDAGRAQKNGASRLPRLGTIA